MKKESMSLSSAIFLFLVGAVLGSVFTFGMQFWNRPVERQDCPMVQTVLLESRADLERGQVQEIHLKCGDGNRYVVDSCCADRQLAEDLEALPSQTSLLLLIHPDSDRILELRAGDRVFLDFNGSVQRLEEEADGFFVLGLAAYLGSLTGLFHIVKTLRNKRRQNK